MLSPVEVEVSGSQAVVPQTSSITWEPSRNANSWAPSRSLESETRGVGLSHPRLKSPRGILAHTGLRATGLVTQMGPGPLTGGHGSPLGTEGSEQTLCAAGHASAKQAASMLWAVMDFQGGGQHA